MFNCLSNCNNNTKIAKESNVLINDWNAFAHQIVYFITNSKPFAIFMNAKRRRRRKNKSKLIWRTVIITLHSLYLCLDAFFSTFSVSFIFCGHLACFHRMIEHRSIESSVCIYALLQHSMTATFYLCASTWRKTKRKNTHEKKLMRRIEIIFDKLSRWVYGLDDCWCDCGCVCLCVSFWGCN